MAIYTNLPLYKDAYIVASSKAALRKLVPSIRHFLREELHLEINTRKLQIVNAHYGVEFLGAYVKPFRTYVSNHTLQRISHKLKTQRYADYASLGASVNSFLGVFSHADSYRMRRVLFGYNPYLRAHGRFNSTWLIYEPLKH